MRLATKPYGTIDVDERQQILFPFGILGFEQLKKYVLLDARQQPFYWLQSMDVEDVAFVLINPRLFRPDYVLDVDEEELKDIDIEISVLTVPEEIKTESPDDYLKQIDIGEDGLIIKGAFGAGLLLPQVFTEHKCDPKRALEMTCQKAGLPTDAWRDTSNSILKFQAQIFKG